MNAIRADEILDNLHSVYVDQWDWEKVINPAERNLKYLKWVIRKIYDVVRRTEEYVAYHYSAIKPILPREITFFHSEDLENRNLCLNPREREKAICKEHGAVFIIGIGGALVDGKPHDGRAPDYDDWSTPTNGTYKGLNGDMLLYYPILDCAFELSSMGIRVDVKTLMKQLEIAGQIGRKNLLFHNRLINDELPLSIGGGIGQSRLCMVYLRKAHVGEIQAGIWPEEMIVKCKNNNIELL
jgi:aspartate--ammonia ligase